MQAAQKPLSGLLAPSGMSPASFSSGRYAPQLFFVGAAIVVPFVASALWLKVLTAVAIYTLTSASIAVLYRRLGLVSLAQVSLMGCGGWVALRFGHGFKLPFELNLLAGGLFAGLIGMILAYPALRMRGLYLALITLMAAGGFGILINVIQFPNGGGGFAGFEVKAIGYLPRPAIAQSDAAFFSYCLIVVAVSFLLIDIHERSRAGRGWALIRKSEAAAMAAGVNVTLYKVWGFALSGFLAGIAGALLAGNLQLLDARSFPPAESVMIFALTVVGGAWHWYGAVIAALLYRLLPAFLNNLGVDGNAAYIIFGFALIHALSTAPRGLAGQLSDGLKRLRKTEPSA
ncbi:branched-chain amino acid ABC transporter permease [Mesorhizobium sp. M8A.F.Ca.ET.207.01.1.1]|uniref:branched-chain amino acid ABC transporter permease n=2 Tax=unclassified Mesorhizobium TaxID=325217 RepID=UPI001AED8526|nr:branched-chain amino acid ABC transporter permease [Mesorhizobium sp. M8A.F.Ca.ET.207.01.1.1]